MDCRRIVPTHAKIKYATHIKTLLFWLRQVDSRRIVLTHGIIKYATHVNKLIFWLRLAFLFSLRFQQKCVNYNFLLCEEVQNVTVNYLSSIFCFEANKFNATFLFLSGGRAFCLRHGILCSWKSYSWRTTFFRSSSVKSSSCPPSTDYRTTVVALRLYRRHNSHSIDMVDVTHAERQCCSPAADCLFFDACVWISQLTVLPAPTDTITAVPPISALLRLPLQ